MLNPQQLTLYVILFFFSVLPLKGQEYIVNVKSYGVEDGLSHRDVHSIMKDQAGLFWLGTKYGVNRFDGHQFKWYTKETHGLQHNDVSKILEGPNGKLWIFYNISFFIEETYAVDIFDPSTETVQTLEDHYEDFPLQANDLRGSFSMPNGELLLFSRDKELITFDGQQFQRTLSDLPDFNRILQFQVDSNGYLWFTASSRYTEGTN
ncbi:MAG: two-component regulator propeller domain-containing protein [Bacteroidota bacterium]